MADIAEAPAASLEERDSRREVAGHSRPEAHPTAGELDADGSQRAQMAECRRVERRADPLALSGRVDADGHKAGGVRLAALHLGGRKPNDRIACFGDEMIARLVVLGAGCDEAKI